MDKTVLETFVELAKSRLLLWRIAAIVLVGAASRPVLYQIPWAAPRLIQTEKEYGSWTLVLYGAIGAALYAALEAGMEFIGGAILKWNSERRLTNEKAKHVAHILSGVPKLHRREQLLLRCFVDAERRSMRADQLRNAYVLLLNGQHDNFGDIAFPIARDALRDQGYLLCPAQDDDPAAICWIDRDVYDVLMQQPRLVESGTPARAISRLRT